jgi:hypothetical protein
MLLLSRGKISTGVGSEEFVQKTKEELGIRAKGREVRGMEG